MFDINYYNEKFKENLGSIGGSTPSEGMSNWELWGSAKGTNEISLPTDYEELKVVTQFVSGNDTLTFTQTITKEMIENATSNIVQISNSGYSSSGVSLALWFIYKDTNKILLSASSTYTHASYTTTYLYYKKKNGITVNVGTESNWKLWGEVAYSTAFNLPSDWEEIMCVMLDRTSVVINKQQIENKSVVYHQYKFNYYTDKWNEGILHYNSELNSVSCNECSFKVYYKKKCDNVLDINDMGEWKLHNETTSNNYIKLPTDYKEIKMNSYDTNNKNTISVILSKQEIENLNKLDGSNGHKIHCAPNSNYTYYKSSGISLQNFNGTAVNSSTFKSYLYYR